MRKSHSAGSHNDLHLWQKIQLVGHTYLNVKCVHFWKYFLYYLQRSPYVLIRRAFWGCVRHIEPATIFKAVAVCIFMGFTREGDHLGYWMWCEGMVM